MSKTYVVGLTGWWSALIPFLRTPINLPFARLKGTKAIRIRRYFRRWMDPFNYINERWKPGDQVVVLGHSYGASAGTLLCARLGANGIPVDLFISEDQGLDSFVIVDVPIGMTVQEVDEYHVAFERLTYVKDYPKARRHFYDVSPLPGGHTSTFTQPEMVERIAKRIREFII